MALERTAKQRNLEALGRTGFRSNSFSGSAFGIGEEPFDLARDLFRVEVANANDDQIVGRVPAFEKSADLVSIEVCDVIGWPEDG